MTVTEIVYFSVVGVIFTALAVVALRDTGRVARRAEMLELLEAYTADGEGWRKTLDEIHDLPEVTA